MLIKRIELINFRQYIDTTIEFSVDPQKNITIIMGDNGTGKTTLAQAFQWALYGETGFQIKELINRKVREQMTVGVRKSVSVKLDLCFNGVDYSIRRQLIYIKKSNSKIEEQGQAKFTISFVDGNGVQQYMPECQKPYFIKRILPKDLSKFFFFDGEKIEEMADNIQKGKGEDFKEAVYSLVGLGAVQNAIEHLKSKSSTRNSVVKALNAEIDANSKSTEQLKRYNSEIMEYEQKIDNANMEKLQIESELESIKKDIEENQAIIFTETPKMKLREEYVALEKEVKNLKKKRLNMIGQDLLKSFQKGIYGYVMTPIMKDEKIHRLLELSAPQKKVIPGLTKKTIEYLLEKKKCLCGTCLQENTLPYQSVEELLEYSYPKTIGMLKEDHQKMEKVIEREGQDFFVTMKRRMQSISELDAQIEGKETEMADKMNLLANTSKGEEAKRLLEHSKYLETKKNKELIDIEANLKFLEREKNRKVSEKEKLVIVDTDTMRLQRCLAYALAIHTKIKQDYENKENAYRLRLEKGMNEIFESIYTGNIAIKIDAKYKISVRVDEKDSSTDEVERNTAQSYALIFAFIAAVIDLAKKKVNEDAYEEEDKIDEESEGYPLVMDAPLSAFDKTRIKSICTEIPRIADQVIMFIKDTDGTVAKEYMNEKIGLRYTAVKVNDSNLESQVMKEEV